MPPLPSWLRTLEAFLDRGASTNPRRQRPQARRLGLEVLEDRTVPSVTAADGFQTQSLSNSSNPGGTSQYQYVSAGSFQTVSSERVYVGPGKTGLFDLGFQAALRSNSSNDQATARYLIDGQTDPNDAAITHGTPAADGIVNLTDNGYGAWGSLGFTQQITLGAGYHTISVQVEGQAVSSGGGGHDLVVWNPVLHLTGFNEVDGGTAADGYQTQALSNPLNPGATIQQQGVKAGSYQTVSSEQVYVGPGKTGLFDLGFQVALRSNHSKDQATARYLIDGQTDPNDAAITHGTPAADGVVNLTDNGYGAWGSLGFTRQIALGAGYHTISVQVEGQAAYGITPVYDLVASDPVLHLTGYNKANALVGQTADLSQTQSLSNSSNPGGTSQYQYVSAGSFQTVSSERVYVDPGKTGLFDLGFQAALRSNSSNDQATARYLIDGQTDPDDAAITHGTPAADGIVNLTDNGYGAWGSLGFTQQITLGAGYHTISVQVESQAVAASPNPSGHDLVVWNPVLHLTGYNEVNPEYVASALGDYGVWRYSTETGYTRLTSTPASSVSGDDRGDVVAELTGYGVWRYEDATGWQSLTSTNASSVSIAGNGVVAAALTGYGVWRFEDATGWQPLASADSTSVAIDARGDVAADLTGYGVWRYEDAGGWRLLANLDASSVSIAGSGIVAANLAGYGVWRYEDATGFTQLTSTNASSVAVDASGDVAADLTGYGVWRYEDSTGWQALTTTEAAQVAIDGLGDVSADLTGYGVWRYGVSGWSRIAIADGTSIGA